MRSASSFASLQVYRTAAGVVMITILLHFAWTSTSLSCCVLPLLLLLVLATDDGSNNVRMAVKKI